MSRRNSYFVLGLLAAALIGVALLAIPASPLNKEPTLGLDLQGGLEVTLQAVPPANRNLTKEDLDRSVDIMRNRVDKLGVSEPQIYTQGSDQIVIQLPGVKDPEAAAQIIGTTAQLELYDLETSLVGPSTSIQGQPVETASLYALLAQVQSQDKGGSDAFYIVNPKTKRVVSGPYASEEAALKKVGGELPAGRKLFHVPKGMVVVTCGEGAVICPGGNGAGDPRRACGLRLDREPALHGCHRPGHPPLAPLGLHRKAETLVRDLGNGRRALDPRDRNQRTQPRDRLQGRDADDVPHAGADVARTGAA